MPAESFKVRIGHFSPNTPAVDFLVDGYPVLTEREYRDIPGYTEHEVDEYEVAVKTTATEELLLSESIAFQPDTYHTLLFIGLQEDPEFKLLIDGPSEA